MLSEAVPVRHPDPTPRANKVTASLQVLDQSMHNGWPALSIGFAAQFAHARVAVWGFHYTLQPDRAGSPTTWGAVLSLSYQGLLLGGQTYKEKQKDKMYTSSKITGS